MSCFEERNLLHSIENKDQIKILKVEELLAEESFASSSLSFFDLLSKLAKDNCCSRNSMIAVLSHDLKHQARIAVSNQSCSSVDQPLEQSLDSITPAIPQKAKRSRKRKAPVIIEQSTTTIESAQSQSPVVKEEQIKIKGAPKKTFSPLQNVKMEEIKLEKQCCQLCAQHIQNDFLTCVQCGQLTGCTNCMLSLCQQQLTKCPRCSCIWDFRSFQVNYTIGNFLFPFAVPNSACCQLISELRDQYNA
uniref:RING-type domain-containing protein n=1 Tax=Ditylenchus dipsaci TaxID=166011 RepID=A0A915EAA1_9BILA